MTSRTRTFVGLFALGLFASFVGAARAAEPNAAGTWSWTMTRNGEETKLSLKLKQDGEKLTGMMVSPRGETEIGDGKVDKDGNVSFTVTRERNGEKVVQKYTGKVLGDALNLETEFERNGEKMTRKIEAKRDAKTSA